MPHNDDNRDDSHGGGCSDECAETCAFWAIIDHTWSDKEQTFLFIDADRMDRNQ